MTIEEIFSGIAEHMVKGLMVHEQLANYYDFLGLQGYKKCHECHFFEESKTYRKLCHYYIKTYNKLIPEMRFENPEVIPVSWYQYTRQDVDIKTKRNAVQTGLNKWVSWERSTLTMYQKMYKQLIELGEIAAAGMLMCIINDVQNELQTAEKYQLNKVAIDYDMAEIINEQKILHHKYKNMIKN